MAMDAELAKLWRPLPKSWIDKHIVWETDYRRELELGMQPIQQGFSGYVPRELKEKYPDARYSCSLPGAVLPGLHSWTRLILYSQ